MNFAAEMKLQDFKLQEEQDTRLVQVGSTLFKIKCRASQGVREAVESDGAREGKIQRDLKRATAVILSQVIQHNTLPDLRTDNIAVYSDSHFWAACDKLYFAHRDQALSAHPRVILIFVSLPPLPPPPPNNTSILGKHKRDVSDDSQESYYECSPKKMKTALDEHNTAFVPDPSEASLPGREGRVVPEREVVTAAAEQSKKRLHLISQPHWTEEIEEEGVEEDPTDHQPKMETGKSFFQYVKSFLGWS